MNKKNSGQAILLTILSLGGTMLVATTIAGLLMRFQIRQTADLANSTRAIYAADAGLEWGLYEVYKGKTPLPSPLANGSVATTTCWGRDATGVLQPLQSCFSVPVNPTLNAALIGYWRMDDGSGSAVAADSTVNNKDLYLYDAVISNGDGNNPPTWLSGANCQVVGCLSFDGVDDYLEGPTGSGFYDIDINQAKTIMFWLKAGIQPTDRILLWKEWGCIGWSAKLGATGLVSFNLSVGNDFCNLPRTGSNVSSVSRLDNNVWHHVVAVVDRPNQSLRLYVDGQIQNPSLLCPNQCPNNTQPGIAGAETLRFGTDWQTPPSASPKFQGLLDEVRIYEMALSATDIASIHNVEKTGGFTEVKLINSVGAFRNSSRAFSLPF